VVETPASGQGRGYDVARLRHAPAACVEPRLVGCVDDAHADVPSRRRVGAKAVQSVQQAKASAGHSSKVTAGCTDEGLTLGLASLEATTTTTARSLQPYDQQICAKRVGAASSNYVASAHEECGVSRVGRLAVVGGAWLRQTRDNAGAEACLSTATISKLTLGLASQGGLQTRHHPVPARTCQQRRRALRLQPELEQSAPAAPWLDLRQACRSGCPTEAGVPNTHKKVATSTGKPVIPVPAASAARILRRVLRPSSGATTCSTHCRRRSVWQDYLPDTATSTTTTGSDQLIGQRHGVDVGKCDGRFAESDGAPFGIHSCHLLSCCYRCFVSDLGPMLLSGSSALFCET